jgi:sugar/nucleoside kinase (ribokinase family)
VVADDFEAVLLTGCDGVHDAIQELHRRGVQNVIIKQKHDSLTFSDGKMSRAQIIPRGLFIQDSGAVECLTAWAGITLARTADLAYAAYVGALAMAFSFSRHGAQDSLPYPTELGIIDQPTSLSELPSTGLSHDRHTENKKIRSME